MKRERLLLATLCMVMAPLAWAQESAAPATASDNAMTPSRMHEMGLSNDDKEFFNKAASGGMFEVESSRLAQTKTTDPDIKQFAQLMIDDHTKVSDQLQALAQSKGFNVPTAMATGDQKQLDKLNKAQAGKDFDKAYCKDMVSSHKDAVALFDNAARNSKDKDIRSFAAQTLPTLESHGGKAKTLEKAH